MMGESGDKIPAPFLDYENTLVTKLINLSEEAQRQDDLEIPDYGLSGWLSLNPWKEERTQRTSLVKSATKNTALKENGAKAWKSAYYPGEHNQHKDDETPPKRSKKRIKFRTKRIEELSVPRKIRNKVEITSCNKVVLPFHDANPLKNAEFMQEKLMKKIALQYSEDFDQAKAKLYRCHPVLRTEIPHSANERNSAEQSVRNSLKPKRLSHSAKSRKHENSAGRRDPSLAKTRANVNIDWEVLPTATEVATDTLSETSTASTPNVVDLPVPQVKFSLKSSNKKILFPPVYAKRKRPIRSVTAITQGNLKAGIKSHSICQLRRQMMPQTRVILPKLSGSKVEVPLLPRSPDFLHRLL